MIKCINPLLQYNTTPNLVEVILRWQFHSDVQKCLLRRAFPTWRDPAMTNCESFP